MAHYKETAKGQGLFLVDLSEQILKGTYEYTLTRLIDNKLSATGRRPAGIYPQKRVKKKEKTVELEQKPIFT